MTRRAARYALRLPPARSESAAAEYLRSRLGAVRGADMAIRLLERGLHETTRAQYDRLFGAFDAELIREGSALA